MRILKMELDAVSVAEWAKSSGIPRYDIGYLAHAFMRRFFNDDSPQPFLPLKNAGCLCIEGVLPEDAEIAVFEKSPDVLSYSVEEITPPHAGETVSFRVRLCPVMRNGSSGKEVETDAFLVMLRRAEASGQTPPKRMQVYRQWAAGRFADCLNVSKTYIERYEQIRPCRRGALGHLGAPAAIGWRPVIEVSMSGVVIDAERFAQLARRGIGRHKAFGFGYLRFS